MGNVTAVTDPNGNVTTSVYDADRRVKTITTPATAAARGGLVTSNTYDPDGHLIQVQQSAGGTVLRTTSATYTLTGQIATATDANGNVAQYVYDSDDRLAGITDAMWRTTIYGYDALSRRISVSNLAIQAAPLLQQTYTPDGLVGGLTDANGNMTGFTPDGFDRLATTTYPNASAEGLTYDADSNVLTRTTRANQTITFTYDTLNRLATKTAPSEPSVSYGYDLAGRTTSVSDNSAAVTGPLGPVAYATNFAYDALNRPTNVAWSPALTAVAPAASGVTFTHAYNKANQRSGQQTTDNSWWSYPTIATTVSYTANNLNQYTAVGAVTPTYDGNGNLASDGTFTYCYDAENHLTSVLSAGTCASPTTTVATYAYDAQGRRKSKTVGGTTTIFVTDADNREVLEYNGTSGAIGNWYAYALGPNAVLNQNGVAAGTRTTLIPDILGSMVASLDAGSGTLTKIAYGVYGEGPSSGSFCYTGQRVDPETNGLYYYRARHYIPAWGRFLQPDPVGYRAGANLYRYVGNDPLNLADPYGLTQDSPQPDASFGGGNGFERPPIAAPAPAEEGGNVQLAMMPNDELQRELSGNAGPGHAESLGGGVGAFEQPQLALPAPEPLPQLPSPPVGTQQSWQGPVFSGPAPSTGIPAYRIWGGDTQMQGSWFTPEIPASSGGAIQSLSLPAGNSAQFVAEEGGHLLMRGMYKGIPVKKAVILEGGAKCVVLLDSFSCLDQGAFRNLFCLGRDGDKIWTAPLPETHDRFVDFNFNGERVVAYSISGYRVTLEVLTGRFVDQVFVK